MGDPVRRDGGVAPWGHVDFSGFDCRCPWSNPALVLQEVRSEWRQFSAQRSPIEAPNRHFGKTSGMAFGQQLGPPASSTQVKELLTLLNHVGHTDFRDARGPMGFTQRQAAGKFTRDEATGFIA